MNYPAVNTHPREAEYDMFQHLGININTPHSQSIVLYVLLVKGLSWCYLNLVTCIDISRIKPVQAVTGEDMLCYTGQEPISKPIRTS